MVKPIIPGYPNICIFFTPQANPQKIVADTTLRVTGSVDVDNTVFIKGSVDANIESINGYNKFYKDPRTGEYYVLPVTGPYQ